MPTSAPRDLKADTAAGELVITWADGRVARLPFRPLRGACGCAHCVDEMTGKRLVGPDDVDENVAITDLSLVGRYAIKITWSDGHDTGLYTWERLRGMG